MVLLDHLLVMLDRLMVLLDHLMVMHCFLLLSENYSSSIMAILMNTRWFIGYHFPYPRSHIEEHGMKSSARSTLNTYLRANNAYMNIFMRGLKCVQ